jgi:uncharacterized membrane protein YqjE
VTNTSNSATNNAPINNGRSLASHLQELKNEFTEFVNTRVQMLKAELKSKLDAVKTAAPMMIVALVLGVVGFIVLTGALVAAIAMAFEGTLGGWALAMLIVGLAYCLIAGGAATFAVKTLTSDGLAPKRTMRVLQQDQAWLASEARTQL